MFQPLGTTARVTGYTEDVFARTPMSKCPVFGYCNHCKLTCDCEDYGHEPNSVVALENTTRHEMKDIISTVKSLGLRSNSNNLIKSSI